MEPEAEKQVLAAETAESDENGWDPQAALAHLTGIDREALEAALTREDALRAAGLKH